jgi:hypothetical protein
MARFNGLFEGFTGKLGNLVSYKLKGKQVIRLIGRTIKAPTTAQLVTRQKMALVNGFLKTIVPVINLGYEFEVMGTDRNPYNAAVSYHTKHAMQGVYPNLSLDYSRALISTGPLEPAVNPAVALAGNVLEFTWAVAADMDWDIKNDRSMLLVCCPELQDATYILSGARRSTGKDESELPAEYLGKELNAYIAFAADDRQSVSDSVWVTLPQ